jgi:type II secretory pathway pseudopilin PulG
MKAVVMTVAAAAALFLPPVARSQSDATLTRAQVRAELAQLKQAGYDPARGGDPSYPSDIQAAEARISAQSDTGAYGGATSGLSASGSRLESRPATAEEMKQIYFGGQ